MPDLIPTEAVEAAARALCVADGCDPDHKPAPSSPPSETPDPAWTRYVDDARAALTAAAPYIAAQARALPAENLQIVNGWLVERGAHDLDYPAGAAYGPYPDSDAEPLVKLDELPGWPGDAAGLRAGIKALRDEWRARPGADYLHDHADALDALLREGE